MALVLAWRAVPAHVNETTEPVDNRGGILSIAGIHLSDVPVLNYERELFYEREIRSVTANTRADGEAFLRFAADHRLAVTTHEYPLAQAQQALQDLKAGRFDGAAVLRCGTGA